MHGALPGMTVHSIVDRLQQPTLNTLMELLIRMNLFSSESVDRCSLHQTFDPQSRQ